jgi:hypothetical protein
VISLEPVGWLHLAGMKLSGELENVFDDLFADNQGESGRAELSDTDSVVKLGKTCRTFELTMTVGSNLRTSVSGFRKQLRPSA